jgi:ribosome-associated protein
LIRPACRKRSATKHRAAGARGGQNVNKVSSKVELLFNINDSALFTDEEKLLLNEKLQSRFNKDGLVQVICDEERSQYLNKEIAVERLIVLLGNALIKPKIRKKLKVSKAAKLARLGNKKAQSDKKENRKKNFDIN